MNRADRGTRGAAEECNGRDGSEGRIEMPGRSARVMRRAFTLTELLVVIGLIAVVISLVLVAISAVQSRALSAVSMSNMKQWGTGMLGSVYDDRGRLPWLGHKLAGQLVNNGNQPGWWANRAATYAGYRPYREYFEEAYLDATGQEGGKPLPLPPDRSTIFTDPAAELPDALVGESVFKGWFGAGGRRFYFNYVPNEEINDHLPGQWSDPETRVRLSEIPLPATTVLMFEMRSVDRELDTSDYADPADHPFWGEALNRHKGDWQRFAARHRSGGHVLFSDGSVRWVLNRYACTTAGGDFINASDQNDYNKADLIWDPLGPTNAGPGQ